jgi:hypothetical protein
VRYYLVRKSGIILCYPFLTFHGSPVGLMFNPCYPFLEVCYALINPMRKFAM